MRSDRSIQKINCLQCFITDFNLFFFIKRIMVIEDGAFDELKSLEWLYLSSNRLFTLSPELFRPIILPKRLKVLDIHGKLDLFDSFKSEIDFFKLYLVYINFILY